jgi:hypothetical protein
LQAKAGDHRPDPQKDANSDVVNLHRQPHHGSRLYQEEDGERSHEQQKAILEE